MGLGDILKALFGGGAPDERVAVVKTLYAPDGRHRALFFRRERDGVCGFREEFYDNKVLEMEWKPVRSGHAEQYPDLDAAIAAAKAALPWLHGAL